MPHFKPDKLKANLQLVIDQLKLEQEKKSEFLYINFMLPRLLCEK